MSKESTNVELEPITVVGGEVITDGKEKTEIPPKGKLEIDSPEKEEVVTLKLSGEWPPRETTKTEDKAKDEGFEIGE